MARFPERSSIPPDMTLKDVTMRHFSNNLNYSGVFSVICTLFTEISVFFRRRSLVMHASSAAGTQDRLLRRRRRINVLPGNLPGVL